MSLPTGQYTVIIYGAIKEQRYADAIELLQEELHNFPRSRAALSLLGYCYYHVGNYADAAQSYEKLMDISPENEDYKLYYAQSLYKAGMYPEATKASNRLDGTQYTNRVQQLQAIIKYEQDDLGACKSYLDKCEKEDPDVMVNYANVAYKEGKYEEARSKYSEVINLLGFQADLAYNIALSYYREKNYGAVAHRPYFNAIGIASYR